MSTSRTLYLTAIGVLLVAAVVAGAVLWVRADSRPAIEVLLPTVSPSPELKVYVSGAVAQPGVYTLKEGDRVIDAIVAAGGATEDADLSAVNQALRVRDEDHFLIPRVGDDGGPTSSGGAIGDSGKVNINTAAAKELETLPGIGEVKAQAIVAYREKNDRFQAPEDILQVSGIGPVIFEAIRTSSLCDRVHRDLGLRGAAEASILLSSFSVRGK